jgi:hypothetical protein
MGKVTYFLGFGGLARLPYLPISRQEIHGRVDWIESIMKSHSVEFFWKLFNYEKERRTYLQFNPSFVLDAK